MTISEMTVTPKTSTTQLYLARKYIGRGLISVHKSIINNPEIVKTAQY
jgi:hypothetical protein